MTTDYHREGTALGCVTLCDHCGYAIQLRRHRWEDVDRPGIWHEGDFWDHFVDNVFTCHTAVPKLGVLDAAAVVLSEGETR